uniref:Uncharacterized protein n=1 Tax=biofilter metagenome TaxID=1070537 RepID=A0A193SD55_9ZZZZ
MGIENKSKLIFKSLPSSIFKKINLSDELSGFLILLCLFFIRGYSLASPQPLHSHLKTRG